MGRKIETKGEFEGWTYWDNEPFEYSQVGPFYYRVDDQGPVGAFRAQERHMNSGGTMHGGCLLTFADFALFALADDVIDPEYAYVTVSLSADFLYGVAIGELVEARGEVLRSGRSMLFVRGILFVKDIKVLNFSGVIKKSSRKITHS